MESKANQKQIGGTHYKTSIEPWDAIVSWELGYLDGNVVKYVARWRRKGGLADLKKAQHYLEKLIEEEEKKQSLYVKDVDFNKVVIPDDQNFPLLRSDEDIRNQSNFAGLYGH